MRGGNEMTKNLNELSGTELVNVMNEVMAEVKSRLDEGTVTKYVAREIPSTVTPNQQRAELIQRAREFVEGQKNNRGAYKSPNNKGCFVRFIINQEKRTVVALLEGAASKVIHSKGIAKCMPGDVFNESIGKAIALAKALKIDIPQEFMEAVQPTNPVIGMIFKGCEGDIREIAPIGQWTQESMKSAIDSEYVEDNPIQIIDDTNAVYQFESVGE